MQKNTISSSTEERLLKAKLAKKMNEAREMIGRMQQTGKNNPQNYFYLVAANLSEEVQKAFNKIGIGTFYNVCDYEYIKKDRGYFVRVKVIIELVDTDTGYSTFISAYGDGQDFGDKAIYKAQTGAQKYAYRNTLLIPTGNDPEEDKDTKSNSYNTPTKKINTYSQTYTPDQVKKATSIVDRLTNIAKKGNDLDLKKEVIGLTINEKTLCKFDEIKQDLWRTCLKSKENLDKNQNL